MALVGSGAMAAPTYFPQFTPLPNSVAPGSLSESAPFLRREHEGAASAARASG